MSGRTKQRPLEWQLLVLVTLALTFFGLVMVYSATSASAALGNGNPIGYLERQGVYAAIGFALLIFAARYDFRRLRALAPPLIVISLCPLRAVLVVGERINGARRWIAFGPAAFQPSELAKLALVIWCAAYLARRPAPQTLQELAKPIGLLVGVFCLLVLVEPDLGTVIAIVVMVGAMLLVSGTRLPTLAAAYGIVITLGAIAAWTRAVPPRAPPQLPRPVAGPAEHGFQTVQAMIGLGSGGIFGARPRPGHREDPLPPRGAHRHDLRGHRRGARPRRRGHPLPGVLRLRLRRPAHRARAARIPFGKRLAAGITALVCGQAAINLAAVLGLAPLTGIPLPFVSYGGSSLVIALAVGRHPP